MTVAPGARVTIEDTCITIAAGPHFAMIVAPQINVPDEFAKGLLRGEYDFKKPKIVSQNDDAVVFTGKGTRDGYHFVANVIVDGVNNFECDEVKDSNVDFTKKDVDAMVEACLTLAAK